MGPKAVYLVSFTCIALALGRTGLRAQDAVRSVEIQSTRALDASVLPDSPGALLAKERISADAASLAVATAEADPSDPFATAPRTPLKPARRFHRVVRTDEYAEPLTVRGKLELSIMCRLTLSSVGSTLLSAGWSQMLDSRPHYGTDSGAFGERLGAAAIKQTSQSFFNYGVFASAFHDDPRYYVVGPSKPIVNRALRSALATVVTRKDNGNPAINWPNFAGDAVATALTNFYYPKEDHGFAKSADAFATSLATSILSNEVNEFTGDLFRLVRHKH